MIEEVEPGGILGEMAWVAHAPRSASVLATGDSEVACINQNRFRFLILQISCIATEAMRRRARQLRQTAPLPEC